MMRWVFIALAFAACGLEERSDFLIGRQCDRNGEDCDPGQECLPHQSDPSLQDFRCRDRASFEPIEGQDPPLAYCNADITCPGDLVCNADRIRVDGGLRPLVCKRPDDVFAPPLEGE
jgi:hypothetical protein